VNSLPILTLLVILFARVAIAGAKTSIVSAMLSLIASPRFLNADSICMIFPALVSAISPTLSICSSACWRKASVNASCALNPVASNAFTFSSKPSTATPSWSKRIVVWFVRVRTSWFMFMPKAPATLVSLTTSSCVSASSSVIKLAALETNSASLTVPRVASRKSIKRASETIPIVSAKLSNLVRTYSS